MRFLKGLLLFIYSELDTQQKCQQGQNNKKNFTGNLGKPKNFGKRFSATFNQHKTLLKALTWPIQISELSAHSILSY